MTNAMTNQLSNILLIDPSSSLASTPYIATLVYNFALHFGVLPFFILIGIVFLLGVLGFFLWKKFFSKPTESTLSISDIEMLVVTSQQPTLEKITQILENIKSHLRTDEVVIILRLVENYIAFQIFDTCRYIQTTTISDDDMKRVFHERVSMIINTIDREILTLPDVSTAVITSELKIKTITDRTEDFILTIKNDKRYESLKTSVEIMVKNIAMTKWYK
jgi:TATA-box binding protein (TBP) (component of TFIID and TFIIIB)